MRRSSPIPVTSKMKGGVLATGLGTVFLVAGTMILDPDASPIAATGFYIFGASAIVIGIAVFLRDYRMERSRARHVQKKGGQSRGKDWKPRIEVTSHRDGR